MLTFASGFALGAGCAGALVVWGALTLWKVIRK